MNITKQVTVLGAKRLDFENNGDKIQGVSVFYYADALNEPNQVGCIPAKAWMPLDSFPNFEKRSYPVDALCSLDVDMAKGKLVPKSFDFNLK